MTLTEGPLSVWKEWFSNNRAENPSILTSLDIDFESLPVLIRLFTAQDGKAPKNGTRITGTIWKTKNIMPRENLIVLYSKGSAPLVLCLPENTSLISDTSSKKDSTQKLSSPYHWRCRVCSAIIQSKTLEMHCGVNVRQLAPVSEHTKLWFDKYLEQVSFTFIPPNLLTQRPGMIHDSEKIELAIRAGNELQQLITDLDLSCPAYFQVFNPQTRIIRVSDLKKKEGRVKGLKRALDSALKHIDKDVPPMKTAPKGGPIEIGHVFDELFEGITNSISSSSWDKGSKVRFDCEELGFSVTGTPDLDYEGIPVEMKTAKGLALKGEKSNLNKNTLKTKWKTNYLPQLAMYSNARGMDWMLLLLISKSDGRFSVIPVDPKVKLANLRKDWNIWSKDKALMEKVEKYLVANPKFSINSKSDK